MNISQQLIFFLHGWEACRLIPYQDDAGYWTIGWGHKMNVWEEKRPYTQAEVDDIFETDLDAFVGWVNQLITGHTLQQHEFDALVAFAYNVGADIDDDTVAEGLGDSTLLRYVLQGRMGAAAAEWTKWERAGNRLNHGVLRRRAAEQAIFLCADYTRKP